jgi:hypothetical protein
MKNKVHVKDLQETLMADRDAKSKGDEENKLKAFLGS